MRGDLDLEASVPTDLERSCGLPVDRDLSPAQEIARVGKVRLLLVLRDFNGWERGADWGDLRFYEAFGQDVERIAIVGDEKWRDQVRLFILADVRQSPVRFFPSGQIDQARAWLSL